MSGTTSTPCFIEVGCPRAIAAHAGRTVLVASLIPTGIFYLVMSLISLPFAIASTVAWYYGVLLSRVVRRRPVVGAAMIGAGLMSLRAIVVFWTGSTYLYFLQPVAGTVATATAFALTALAGRPLIERLAHDFVPVPPALSERLRAARFFDYTSVLWSLTYAINAAGTVWLLSSSSLGMFLLLKSFLGPVLTASAVSVTYLLLRRLLRREGVHLRWTAPATV